MKAAMAASIEAPAPVRRVALLGACVCEGTAPEGEAVLLDEMMEVMIRVEDAVEDAVALAEAVVE